jgi:hypothetical protein
VVRFQKVASATQKGFVLNKQSIVGLIFLFIFLCLDPYAWARDDTRYFPTPTPINIAPGNNDNSSWGIGYNIINLSSEWEDSFFTFESEHIGDIEYRVQHIVFAFLNNKRKRSSAEYDLLIGRIKTEAGTKR